MHFRRFLLKISFSHRQFTMVKVPDPLSSWSLLGFSTCIYMNSQDMLVVYNVTAALLHSFKGFLFGKSNMIFVEELFMDYNLEW